MQTDQPRKALIVDLDGTIALIDHRRHFVAGPKKQWDQFYMACVDDKPNPAVINTVRAFHKEGYLIYIFSGRSKIVQVETIRWLKIHEVPYFRLLMREANDYTPDEILKLRWLNELDLRGRVEFVMDDREKVVQMWRAQGLVCFQVAYGDF